MIYSRLAWAFMKIGALGFGGGLAILSLIKDSISSFSNITAEAFANIAAIAQITPGPVAINAATFVGYETAGFLGAAIATISVAVPSFIIISIIAKMTEKYKDSPAVKGALKAVRPATVGMIGSALITLSVPALAGESRLGARFLPDAITSLPIDIASVAVFVITIVLMLKYNKNPFIILLTMGALGALIGV